MRQRSERRAVGLFAGVLVTAILVFALGYLMPANKVQYPTFYLFSLVYFSFLMLAAMVLSPRNKYTVTGKGVMLNGAVAIVWVLAYLLFANYYGAGNPYPLAFVAGISAVSASNYLNMASNKFSRNALALALAGAFFFGYLDTSAYFLIAPQIYNCPLNGCFIPYPNWSQFALYTIVPLLAFAGAIVGQFLVLSLKPKSRYGSEIGAFASGIIGGLLALALLL